MHRFLIFLLFAFYPCFSQMTSRFPLACKKPKYTSPYSFDSVNVSDKTICCRVVAKSCGENAKCALVQGNARKIMVASRQSEECGTKQITGNTASSRSPYNAWFVSANGQRIDGLSAVWFHHNYQGTQTAFEFYKGGAFKLAQDSSLDGYTLCIGHPTSVQSITSCLLDDMGRMTLSTFDVSDHTCDDNLAVLDVDINPDVFSPPPLAFSPPPLIFSPPLVFSPPPKVFSPPPLVFSPPPKVFSPPPLISSPSPEVFYPPPPSLEVFSPPPLSLELRILIKYPATNATYVQEVLCPALEALFYNACTVQGVSTTGVYYGMRLSMTHSEIRTMLQSKMSQFTRDARLVCSSSIAVYKDKEVVLRYTAARDTCVKEK